MTGLGMGSFGGERRVGDGVWGGSVVGDWSEGEERVCSGYTAIVRGERMR